MPQRGDHRAPGRHATGEPDPARTAPPAIGTAAPAARTGLSGRLPLACLVRGTAEGDGVGSSPAGCFRVGREQPLPSARCPERNPNTPRTVTATTAPAYAGAARRFWPVGPAAAPRTPRHRPTRLGTALHTASVGVTGAGDGRAGGFGDLGSTVGVQDWLSVRTEGRGAEFDKAHAAIAGHRQFGMIAIMRHIHVDHGAGLDHRCGYGLPRNRVGGGFGNLDFAAIHLHLDLFDCGRRLGFSCGCC